MEGQNDRILLLLSRFERGEATEEELIELDKWYHSFDHDAKYTDRFSPSAQVEARAALFTKIEHRIDQELPTGNNRSVKRSVLWQGWSIAAMFLICSAIGGYFLVNDTKSNADIQIAKIEPGDIAPGGNKAFLVLSDGKRINLNDSRDGELATQAGISITKTSNGVLVYTMDEQSSTGSESGYNIIETPRGGQYLVRLHDGTQVWLNAASSIKFPASFTSHDERRVEVSGEAYFEVAHDKKRPFKVNAGKQLITVLGTHFNLNAYHDEPAVRTTLLEGSVQVTSGVQKIVIKPGQQAVLSKDRLQTRTVDTDEVIAWQSGIFQFSDENLESIMRKVSRWYDVEVEYENEDVKTLPLTGIITQFTNVSKILRMLELTQQVRFKVVEKKIIVLKK